jgi:dGTPase
VQLVSSFARGIAEILCLNGDLIEAIALGHDVGHPPFGHEGEQYLSKLSQEHGNSPFAHPWQSCRLFTDIEALNLGLAVYDGFLCHDGGMCGPRLIPRFGKDWDGHIADKQSKLAAPEANIWPGTLEGCLVKLCDTISYLGRDFEDAIQLGIISRSQMPKTILGNSNREMLACAAEDIIINSYHQDYIAVSDEVYEALKTWRKFNFENIYFHPQLKKESQKIERSYRYLFEHLLEEYSTKKEESFLWKNFLNNKSEKYLSDSNTVTYVVDYLAGMTDNFFLRTLEKFLVPSRILLN